MTSQTNPLLTRPLLPQFLNFTAHALVSLLAITLASLVDGIFVGQFVGSDALAAVTLLLPFFTLMFALSLMLAIGGSVQAGWHLAKGEKHAASALMSSCIMVSFLFSAGLGIWVSIQPHWLFAAIGAPEVLHPFISEYLEIMLLALVVQMVTMVLYYFVRADQQPKLATQALLGGAASNIVLNALFVGAMGLGLYGAALATLLSQILQFCLLSRYFLLPTHRLVPTFASIALRPVMKAAQNGCSEGLNELSVGIIVALINWLLVQKGGKDAVAAFALVNYCLFISVMLCYSILDGMAPLLSHNVGAASAIRIKQTIKIGLIAMLLLSILLTASLLVGKDWLTTLFITSESAHIRDLASDNLMIFWPMLLFMGFNMLAACVLTCLQRPLSSSIIAVSRSLLLPASFLLLMHTVFTDYPLLIALPLAELCAFLLTVLLILPISTGYPYSPFGLKLVRHRS